MIERVIIDNFRSIQALELRLKPLTCLIGPNNSGKSNLIDSLRFLQDGVYNGPIAALGPDGGLKVPYYGAGSGDNVSVETSGRYTIRDLAEVDPAARKDVSVRYRFEYDPKTPAMPYTLVSVEDPLGSKAEDFDNLTPELRNSELRPRWAFYGFRPNYLKGYGRIARVAELSRDGQNFAAYLLMLNVTYPESFSRISREVCENFPDVESVVTPFSRSGEPPMVEVGIREKAFRQWVAGDQLSDGLVGFIASVTALYGPDLPSLVAFEEPENYIHPRLMERLVAMFRGASRDTQILLTTHSIALLDQLELDDIVIVEKGPEGTTARRPKSTRDLKAFLKEAGLGRAYNTGLLGGVPY
jgi:predicted ATPase